MNQLRDLHKMEFYLDQNRASLFYQYQQLIVFCCHLLFEDPYFRGYGRQIEHRYKEYQSYYLQTVKHILKPVNLHKQ